MIKQKMFSGASFFIFHSSVPPIKLVLRVMTGNCWFNFQIVNHEQATLYQKILINVKL